MPSWSRHTPSGRQRRHWGAAWVMAPSGPPRPLAAAREWWSVHGACAAGTQARPRCSWWQGECLCVRGVAWQRPQAGVRGVGRFGAGAQHRACTMLMHQHCICAIYYSASKLFHVSGLWPAKHTYHQSCMPSQPCTPRGTVLFLQPRTHTLQCVMSCHHANPLLCKIGFESWEWRHAICCPLPACRHLL